ncbi:60S ribosomal protein L35, L29 [Malassezia caprae]|uniref:60S ribosomal protein L35, L29 n=1 Tax=Malassezia caprae TaxID=1381934 RepID=A0AAF0E8H2_9BASI|nr:60S ribosomal protein L35, L29 [Malassezia caprae]
MGDSEPTLLQNNGLALPSCATAASKLHGTSRSEDRIRAAQRLFHALGHSTRLEQRACVKDAPKRPRISILQSLRLQAQRRHSREAAEHPVRDNGEISFATNMQGTQHCVIATENSTFELVVTPPTPPMNEQEWEGGAPITGVRFSSHKMAQTVPPMPPSPQLQPPPFELAPGRAQQLAQRKQLQAKEAIAWMTLTESPTTRLRTQVTSASADRMRMLTQWNALMAEQVKFQGTQNPNKSKTDLLNQVEELRKELLQLRVQKVAGGASSKLARINTVRKNIARVLTVINLKQRANLRELYKGKKFQPLDLRAKKTRALRRKLAKHEAKATTERQHKKNVHFGTRRFVIKA